MTYSAESDFREKTGFYRWHGQEHRGRHGTEQAGFPMMLRSGTCFELGGSGVS